MTVTVLVPAHNEARTIGQLLAAIDYPVDEVVVVADACTDETASLARAGGATVIVTELKDKASAQNAALHAIGSTIVVGFDADTVPLPGCISRLVADIQAGYDATCATVLPIQPNGFWVRGRRFAYALGRRWWRLCQAKVGRLQVLTGAAYAFRTEVVKDAGGFPSGLISADMDLTWQLHAAGLRLGYSADAIALTQDPETFAVYRAQMRRWAAGYAQTMAKYRRQLWHWRSALVVWTSVFDLMSMLWWEALVVYSLLAGSGGLTATLLLWAGLRMAVATLLVSTVVGVREAMLGLVPYTLVNILHRWWYAAALIREWIIGRRYAAWTGRQGRPAVMTPLSPRRAAILSTAVIAVAPLLALNIVGA